MGKFKIVILSLFFSFGLLLFPVQSVFAHATPLSYEPDGSVVLTAVPAEVRIDFSERVEPKASSITVYAPDGSLAGIGSGSVDPKDSHYFFVSLKNAGQGSYTVSWQVVSADDGHFTQGAYVFSVGHTSDNANAPAQSGFQIEHSSSIPEGMTIGIELVGLSLLLGLLTVVTFIWRPMRRKNFAAELENAGADGIFIKRLNLLLIGGFVLALCGGISYLIFKSNELKDLQSITFWQAFKIFLPTFSAKYTVYRMLVALAFFGLFWKNRAKILKSEKITKTEIVLFLLLDLAALFRARVSHAAASNFHPAISVVINFIHLYFKDLWIGGLLAFIILLAPVIRRLKNLRLSAFALTEFSKIVAVSFAVGGATGVYVIWLHLKSFSNILTTDWGSKFIILSFFAAALFFTRMFHMLVAEPRAVKAIKNGQNDKLLEWLPITLAFEAGMGIFILLATAVLIITTPPIAQHYNFQRQAVSQGANISLTQDPYESTKLLVTLTDAKTAAELPVNNLIVTLTDADKNIGPITAQVQQRFVGGYVFDESQLAPAGNWQIDITAQRDNAYDAVASFSLNYPDEINYAKARSQDRQFDGFAMVCVLTAIIILILAFFLYRHSSRLNKLALTEATHYPLPTNHSVYERGAWAIPLVVGLFVLMFLGGMAGMGLPFLESNFQQLCEKNQAQTMFMWHESVPERAGQATSDLAVPGCMVGVGLGQYQFADEREFLYFTRTPEAQASLRMEPKNPVAGQPMTFIVDIKDYSGQPVQELTLDHDRIMHVVIASRDFSVYSHIHVEDSGPVTAEMLKNAEFPVKYTFPKAGRYLVDVGFTVRAKPFFEQFYLDVGGAPPQGREVRDFSLNKNFDGYNVSLQTSPVALKAGQPVTLNYHITQNNKPVLDLQPYLSVPMHISVISDDQISFTHIHGMLPPSFLDQMTGMGMMSMAFLPSKFGPNIQASVTFPAPGIYHIFGEFKHNGKVVTTHFMVNVK